MLGDTQERVVEGAFEEVQAHVANRAQAFASKLLFSEYVDTTEGPYAVLAGVSQPIKGSGLLPVLMQGARHAMFLIRIRQTPDGISVVATVGGGETLTGFDFGRNKNLVDYLLDGVESSGLPRRERA
ncbi:MAG: hypothetical protein ACPHID_04935 [Thermoplasmatota archaeon]